METELTSIYICDGWEGAMKKPRCCFEHVRVAATLFYVDHFVYDVRWIFKEK